MTGGQYTLDNLIPVLLQLSKKDSRKAKELRSSLYKLPRYRSRKIPSGANNANLMTPSSREFIDAWHGPNSKTFHHNSNNYGSVRTFSDTRERSWDWVLNRGFDTTKWSPPTDTGSEFLQVKIGWENHTMVYDDAWKKDGVWWRHYYGWIGADPDSFIVDGINITSDHTLPPLEDYDISSWGPTAWNRFKPAKPTLDLGQFIAESKDLPRLLYARLEGLKTISDVYIAARFGWEPLLRDIIDMVNFVEKFREQVEFFYRNAGKPVHRKGTVVTNQSVDIVKDAKGGSTDANITTVMSGRAYPNAQPRYHNTVIRERTQTIEFNGTFVFWFDGKPPEVDTLVARLAGLELTPRLVWEVLPWSWLIDYFSNIGDLVSNLKTEVADRQLAKYAYITGKTNRVYKHHGTDGYNTCGIDRFFRTTVRKYCHPFGLASNTTLSARQAAILAALGFSRSQRNNPL